MKVSICTSKALFVVLAIVVIGIITACTEDSSVGKKWLFTEDEAAGYMLDVDPATINFPLSKTTGPFVEIVQPAVTLKSGEIPFDIVNFKSPGSLIVNFNENQAPVKMSSLAVKFRGRFLKGDITKKVAPYINDTSIEADELSIPGGDYLLVMSISDTNDNQTEKKWILKVR